MKQGIQTNFPHEQIRKYGCYFLCLCKWAELVTGSEYDNEQIIDWYHTFIRMKVMRDNCYIDNAAVILNTLCNYKIGNDVKKIFTAPRNETFMVYQKKPDHEHFVLSHKGEIWDCLDPSRPGVKDYKVDSYRVIV